MLTKRQAFRMWAGVLSCLPIWGFLYFLDFPSAALRATIMCSLYALYRVQHRRPNSLQVLITTAFLILLFQPLQLFQLGFQLSFSAVLSIILFFRPIRNWMQTSVQWLNKPLDLIALSISAQIGILPFSVAVFHQFPLAFLLTNLTILWTVPLLIVLCTILIFGYFFAPLISVSLLLNNFLDQILIPYLSFLNETFPPLKSIHWSNLENGILIALILSLVVVAFVKKGQQVSWALTCLLLTMHTCRSQSDQKSEFQFESQIGKHSIWIEKKRTQAWFLSSNPKMTEERVNKLFENWKQKYGVAKIMAYKKTVGKDELTHSQKTFK
jgi:competence protein ComEC